MSEITLISVKNSLTPCFDSAERTFIAAIFPFLSFPYRLTIENKELVHRSNLQIIILSSDASSILMNMSQHSIYSMYLIDGAETTLPNFIDWAKIIGGDS